MAPDAECRIMDAESGSKSVFPILTARGWVSELFHVDKGIVRSLPEGAVICDKLLRFWTTRREHNADVRDRLCLVCLAELKGTKNDGKVSEAVGQIHATLSYDEVKALVVDAQYVTAAIVGEPGKRIPRLMDMDRDMLALARLLLKKSSGRRHVANALSLIFFVQPDKNAGRCDVCGRTAPYTIRCYPKRGCFVPLPQAFLDLIQ